MVLPLLVGAAVAIGVGSALTQRRAGEFTAEIGGRSLTAEQIYSRIRSGAGNGDLMAARDVADELVARYSERGGQLNALVAKLDAAWQGSAADAAASHVTPLDQAFRESSSSLRRTKDALHNQIDSFSGIYTAVQPVPAEPPRSGLLNDVNPFTTDTDRAIDQYNEKAANNVARYESYNQDSTANGRQMRAVYPALPLDVPPISVGDASNGTRVGAYTSDGSTTSSAASATGTGVASERTSNAGPVAPAPDLKGQNPVGSPPTGSDSGGTRPSQVVPAPPVTPGESGQTARNPAAAGPSVGSVPSVTGVPQARRTGAGAGREVLGLGGGPGRSGAGRVGGVSGGGDGRRDASGQFGRGPAAGIDDAAKTVRRGGAPFAGAAGSAAGSGSSAYGASPARTRGDEDIEHKSVLIQPDPHELFGLQELTPPAVIGEEETT